MSEHNETEISETVRQCVMECLHATDRRQCIDEFARRLVNDRGWSQDDAREVIDSAIRVIETIAPHMDPDHANRS
jgi:predicted Ser/Thr protein kinase